MTPNPQKHQRDYCTTMTERNEFRKLKAKDYQSHMRVPNIVDTRKLYDPKDFKGVNFVAIGLGS